MQTPIELACTLTADLIDSMGTELSIVNAARVSFNEQSQELTEKDQGLIKFLMKNRHASPFEHCVATYRIEAPIFVAREWHRHRTQSYNEWSGRYSVMQPRFYAPDYDRPLIQTGKPGAYKFEVPENDVINIDLFREFRFTCQTAWDTYEYLQDSGVAKEVARMILPVNTYTCWYATSNLRNWINFMSLRTDESAMFEIRQLAGSIEQSLHKIYPVTMEEWDKSGRGPL